MNTVAFHTLGCKLNYAETSTIARSFREAGWQKVEFGNHADVTIINTCSVTEQADRECRTIVHRALESNPATFIAVVGCYAQLKPSAIESIGGVDLVLGANEKFNVLHHVNLLNKNSEARVIACNIEEVSDFQSSWSSGDRTRVFLKVQDGCDYQCSFCTIPQARGKSRSDMTLSVLSTIKKVVSDGAKEIILTGVNLGDYGIIDGERSTDFTALVHQINELTESFRVRISSIEPNLLTYNIIETVAKSKKFMPHFHIPLQSGSNKILKLMRRRYMRELYAEKVSLVKSMIPHCCIGVDVITGFPGETESDFLETLHFLNDLDISYLHVFTYSERANTLAMTMQNAVPMVTRRQRNQQLRMLSAKKLRKFYSQFIGTTVNVLMEAEERSGMMHGYSENYIRVKLPYEKKLSNTVIPVELISIDDDCLVTGSLSQELLYI